MKNLSRHADLLCESETSLLMRGIQIGEMSKLGWLIALLKLIHMEDPESRSMGSGTSNCF
jgi:hypothetical protein